MYDVLKNLLLYYQKFSKNLDVLYFEIII